MTIKTVETENEGLKRAFMLTIPAKDIDARVDQEVKRLAPQVRMPGFRPGKVPANLIRKMHGESLQRDALSGAVQDGVQKLLDEKKLRPAMQPEVQLDEKYAPGKDAEVTVRLEALPEIGAPDISGLKLDASFDSLCRLYWRTAVGVALGVRQIVEMMRAVQHPVTHLHLAGGHMRNQMLTQLYADVTGCVIVEPNHGDAVLLGTGMAAATAAGVFSDLASAARSMQSKGSERMPDDGAFERFDRDYRIFLEMHRQRRALDALR